MSTNTQQTNPRAAALSMILGMAVIGCIDNAIAPLSEEMGLWQFYFTRACISVPLIVLASFVGFGTLRMKRLWAVGLRGALVAGAMLFYFGALAFIPLPQALAGLFTSPLFILLITAFGLRQPVGPWRIAAVILGFAGILLVIEPWGDALALVAIMPVLGGLLYALGSIATRTICAGESVLSMLLALFVVQGVMGLVGLMVFSDPEASFVARGWVWPVPTQTILLLLVQAVGSVIGIAFLIRAYALGDASYVTVFEYSVFLFGAFFSWLFFAHVPTPLALVGIAMVALAGIVIVLRTNTDAPAAVKT